MVGAEIEGRSHGDEKHRSNEGRLRNRPVKSELLDQSGILHLTHEAADFCANPIRGPVDEFVPPKWFLRELVKLAANRDTEESTDCV